MADYITYNHSVCNINYHFVWVTKYRKKVLTFPEEIRQILRTNCNQYGWTFREVEVMPDHIHILISTPPFSAPSKIAKLLKSISTRRIFKNHPELRKELWQSHLWASSYYCGTAGNVSGESIKKYIQQQKKDGTSLE
ncbi:MAG: IS200/IS605 family transposase [Promethearchaeota archaeon]